MRRARSRAKDALNPGYKMATKVARQKVVCICFPAISAVWIPKKEISYHPSVSGTVALRLSGDGSYKKTAARSLHESEQRSSPVSVPMAFRLFSSAHQEGPADCFHNAMRVLSCTLLQYCPLHSRQTSALRKGLADMIIFLPSLDQHAYVPVVQDRKRNSFPVVVFCLEITRDRRRDAF